MISSPLNVLIIGGGIGGLCLAHGLKAAGVRVAVYERDGADPQHWLQGHRIHINPIGSRALHVCLPEALWEAFVAVSGRPPAGLGFMTEQLRELVVVGQDFMAHGEGNAVDAHHPISRMALRQILLADLQDVLHFGKTFERYERAADGTVTAFFMDGSTATGNVLVGADGANSRVRKQYLPHARRVEAGSGGMGGKLILTEQNRAWLPAALSSRLNLIMAPNNYTLFNAFFDPSPANLAGLESRRPQLEAAGLDLQKLVDTSKSYLLWAFIGRTENFPATADTLDGAALQQLVKQRMTGWHPDLLRLITEADPDSVGFTTFKYSAPIGPWESSNVTLLGDAIHNMTPVGGMGANMALRDARQLAQQLAAVERGELELLPAIKSYEADMRKYGFKAVHSTLQNARLASSNGRLGREFNRTWFRACNLLPPLKHVFEEQWTEEMRNPAELVTSH
ncbi:oxidoreductase [Dictyobacter alpinus]|uniref:Oxidoreductase n=1 Tax=Dictyobacter alpinus TaxID=2014873 RepID=A0A402BCC6_9CHLR|nr:NAD(P)/FAD-dependent oxidoreductase [Dictyobacter alpinus]GCE28937.1 oxidoreductase [Dictyobacter alpinus]